ncbi:MAG: hypothetical protein K1Y01_14605 [Vicinamibacteria bacterium]|nr:hypothetical protein [Vicinamibacteria bacterium]
MNTRRMFLVAAVCLSAVAPALAADANLGTWKLNVSKSKIPAGAARNNTVVYTAAGDSFKCVVDGEDGVGKPTHNEWTGKFDGKDYALKGDPTADTRAIQMVDAQHYNLTNKKAGKATTTGTITLSADGKTRTLTTKGTDASGKEVVATFVYDRQ